MALVAYRHLLRSSRIAFQGDIPILHAAREQIKESFRKNRALQLGSPAAISGIQHAEEVAKILLENIVQGKNEGDDRYKLRIHEHTERGDNDTIKMPDGKTVKIDGKKCSER